MQFTVRGADLGHDRTSLVHGEEVVEPSQVDDTDAKQLGFAAAAMKVFRSVKHSV